MSLDFLVEDTKKRIISLEEQMKELGDADKNDWHYINVKKSLDSYKRKMLILEDTKTLEMAKSDMKIIMQHTKAVDDKYNCRSVRFMFWLAGLRYMPKGMANTIREYTVNKINAPVCSIVASPKPELPPMPRHMTSLERDMEERHRLEREELMRFRNIAMNYLDYKPTRWESFKERLRVRINKALS